MKKNILFYLLISSLIIGCNTKNNSIAEKSDDTTSEKQQENSVVESVSSDEISSSIEESESISEETSSVSEELSSEEQSSSVEEESSSVEESPSIIEESSSEVESSSSEDESSDINNEDLYWTNDDVKDYYNGVNFDVDGQSLLEQLQSLNSRKRKSTAGYTAMLKNQIYFKLTDYDPNDSSKLIAFYRGTSASPSSMNREHVWPNSHGGNLVEADIHMTRPTLTSDNSDRGNSFYVEGKNDTKYGWDPYTARMTEYYRGVAARIIFYCCVASSKLSLVDIEYSATTNANPDYIS